MRSLNKWRNDVGADLRVGPRFDKSRDYRAGADTQVCPYVVAPFIQRPYLATHMAYVTLFGYCDPGDLN
jgi:hypothetical protein